MHLRAFAHVLGLLLVLSPAGARGTPASEPPRHSTGVILSASELDYPPFAIVREDGSADGFSVELLRAAAHAVGRDVQFRVGPWAEIKQDLIEGRLDALPLVSYSKERDAVLDFTAPYLRMHGAIFVREGEGSIRREADLSGKEVLVMQGDTAHEYALRKNLTSRLIPVRSYEEAMMRLSSGRHDALLVQQLVGLQLLKQLGIENVRSVQSLQDKSLKPSEGPLLGFEQKFCFAVPEGDHELLALLNEGLAVVIADGTYDGLYVKWFSPILPAPPVNPLRVARYVALIVLPLGFAASLVGLWFLKREVRRKTNDLRQQVRVSEEAKAALARNEMQLRTLLNTLPDLVWLKDSDGRYLACNPRFEAFFGAGETEILGKTAHDFVDREMADSFQNNDRIAAEGGNPVASETEITFASDGHREILETIKTPMFDEKGALMGVLGIGRDITRRKQIEGELREISGRLEAILHNSPSLISEVDAEGRYLLVNDAVAAFYGKSPKELVGQRFQDFLPGEVCEGFLDNVARTLESEAPLVVEDRIPTGDSEIVFATTLFPLFRDDGVGEPHSVGVISHDITSRVRAEEELAASHTLLEELARLVPGVIYQYRLYPDGHSAFPYASPGMNDIYEVTPEEVREDAGPVFGRLHPEDFEQVSELIFQSARTQEMYYCTFRVILPRQGLRWRWCQASPRRLEDGSTLWHGIIIDITALKQAEEEREVLQQQLQQAQKMESIGTLAGGIAHDFNNILAAILGYAELSLSRAGGDQELTENLEEVIRAAMRARDLVRQILTFSRKDGEAREPVQAHLVIGEALRLLRNTIPANIPIRTDVCKRQDTVLANPTQLHQIVMNLCTNAYHALQEKGGTLTVKLEPVEVSPALAAQVPDLKQGPHLRLTVQDTGIGMDAETRRRALDPFFTTKPTGEGTGMGLSVVHGIVRTHEGGLRIESEVGRGTRVEVYLPRYQGKAQTSRAAQTALPRGTERVLIVDDEPVIARIAARMLATLGYEAETALTSSDAWERFRKAPDEIDLVLTDQTMPGMTGDVLAQKMLAVRPDLPVVICTGYSSVLNEERARQIGAKGLVPKPFDRAGLAVALREALKDGAHPLGEV